MAQNTVTRLNARYRLPASRVETRMRLDSMVLDVADAALEDAARSAGIRDGEELCIRRIAVPARLRLSAPNGTLAASWRNAMSMTIGETIERGGPDVVRYASRVHAMVDAAVGVATGDLRRAWAWRQLDVWRVREGASHDAAAEELRRVLCAEPTLVVPVLRAVANAGQLGPLVARLPAEAWTALAAAALEAAGAPPFLAAADTPQVAPAPLAPAAARADPKPDVEVAARWPAAIWAAALAAVPSASTASRAVRRALVVFAIADAEPVVLRRADAAAVIVGVESRWLAVAATRPGAELGGLRDPTASPPGGRAAAGARRGPGRGEAGRSLAGDSSEARTSGTDARSTATERTRPTGPAGAGNASDAARSRPAPSDALRSSVLPSPSTESRPGPLSQPEAEPPDRPLPDLRRVGRTEVGGLLFLVHVLGDMGMPYRMARARALARRPLRWTLHQLALTLVATDAADPAALAFAGVAPGVSPAWAGEPPASRSELRHLARLARLMRLRLHDRMDRPALPSEELLDHVCRRPALVVSDPGWFEVRLSLATVSTDIRRAALDLDPGHVPWLGIVLRFAYE